MRAAGFFICNAATLFTTMTYANANLYPSLNDPDQDLGAMDDIYAVLGKGPLNTAMLTDPAQLERERDGLFKRCWLKVGRVEEIPNAGDYKVKQLDILKTSVIVVRSKSGDIHAFHNICSHRGNKVIPEAGHETFGNARAHVLTCRFHGWVFSTDGSLRSVPQKEKFHDGFDTACLGLKRFACAVWQGFVFVNYDPEPAQSLTDYLGGMDDHFAGYPWQDSTFHRRYSSVLNCNWKVALYAFSEGYHVETIHAATLPGLMTFEQRDYRIFGLHSTSALYVPQVGRVKDLPVSTYLGNHLQQSAVHAPRLEELPPKINPQRRNDFQFEFPVFFPNLVMHLGAGSGYPGMTYFTHQFWPIDSNTTYWEGTNFFRAPASASDLVAITHTDAVHRNAWLEDTSTMEETHAALQSGVLEQFHLMDDEVMIRNTHHHIERLTQNMQAMA